MEYYLVDPVILIFLFLSGLTWYIYRRGDKQLTIASVSVLSLFTLLASPLLANSLTLLLEGHAEPVTCGSVTPRAIVVLGGGVRGDVNTISDIDYLYAASFRRAQGALRLAQQYPDLSIIVSGGSGTSDITEADLMGSLLIQQGIKSTRISKERESVNTWESSLNTGMILKKNSTNEIYLVSSAIHMPRAIQVYQKQGLTVCAYPVDRVLVIPKWYELFIPQISALVKTKNALHEIAGIGWYYLSGKI